MNVSPRTCAAMVCAGLCLLTATASLSADVSLSWDPPTTNIDGSPAAGISGYKVYVGTSPGSYSRTIDAGSAACTVGELNDGKTYFFAVTAIDAAGTESSYSNEISTVIQPAPAPEPEPVDPTPPVTEKNVKGDVDDDGEVSLADVLPVLRMAADAGTMTPDQKKRADVWPLDANRNPAGDGSVTMHDALAILRRVVQPGRW